MLDKNRSDGVYLGQLPVIKRLYPYVMPSRTASTIYTRLCFDASHLLVFLKNYNQGVPLNQQLRLFHVLMAIIVRTIHLRPQLNRFIVGKRFYQHKDISIAFAAKKDESRDASMSDLRLVFHGQETLEELREAIDLALNKKHELRNESGGRLLSFAAALPRPLLSLIFSLLGWLDGYNLVPDFIRNVIPLYCSLYLANLGAIGLPGGFHHLFDLGTASTFLVIGPLEKQPMVDAEGAVVARDCLEFYFSFDERVSDGLNIWPSFRLIKVIMRHPTLLTQPELSLDAMLAYENAVTA